MNRVKFSNIERKSNSKTQKGIPLAVTYHPLLKSLSSIVNNNICLLHMDQEVFTPFQDYSRFIRIMVTFILFYHLRQYLYFLSSDMELVMAVVSDVNSVAIAMDSSFLGVRNLLLVIVIFVDCYCYYTITVGIISYFNCMGITVTIYYQFI